MIENHIKIRGARVHNLKNIDVDIPKNKLVVITGLSGSGKSSLAFDTLYAEGQRRYVENLSAYARQFLGVMDKPDVDKIEGISPAISIDQRKSTHNPRSTVGTATEIYDYFRLLFARVGKPYCPKCGKPISRQTIDQIVKQILRKGKSGEIIILGPVVREKKGEHHGLLEEIKKGGFVKVRIDGIIYRIEEALEKEFDKNKKHAIEVVVDRLVLGKDFDRSRFVDSIKIALKLGKGIVIVSRMLNISSSTPLASLNDSIFSENFACEKCGISLPELEPRLFSFNSPFGACPDCQGLGSKLEVDPELVIPNKNLTLAEGAIQPWARASHKVGRQGFFYWKLAELASKYKFSVDEEVKNLPEKIIRIILYGEKPEIRNQTPNIKQYEGVVSWLESKHRETDSDWAREEIEQYMIEKQCETCHGKRLKPEILAVKVAGRSIDEISFMPVDELKKFFEKLADSKKTDFGKSDYGISQPIIKEIIYRLQFLIDVGLNYLTINRKTSTLSGGEEQRIRLATQIGSKLTGVLYILDEPSIGLHVRDQGKLIKILKEMRDLGNTVIVVEHDAQTIRAADKIIDIGPGAGKRGGKIIFEGTVKELLKSHTLTGEYLSGKRKVEIQEKLKRNKFLVSESKNKKSKLQVENQNFLTIKGARENNLKNIDALIPLGKFVCVTGVSGSGKSSLVNDILAKALLKNFYRAKDEPGEHSEILGIENLNKVVLVDQLPIGRTPRSNPATYTGIYMHIRDIFSQLKEAKARGYQPGRFSFNLKGGRCETCEGQGVKKIEMYFLPDVYVECEECHGKRFNRETLLIEYKGKNIADVLSMTVEEASGFFKNIPPLYQKLKTLNDVGLNYIQIGQPAPSLSGGEAQRVKLATELSKTATGKSLYILDEPTTGLHFEDVRKLLYILKGLVSKGNTVLVIEHNMDVIKNADWIIDLGPEGGEKGGYIVAEGTPKEVMAVKKSYTGAYLKKL